MLSFLSKDDKTALKVDDIPVANLDLPVSLKVSGNVVLYMFFVCHSLTSLICHSFGTNISRKYPSTFI